MQLRSEILKEHSKKQSIKIAAWIGNNEQRFAELLQLFLNDEYPVVQRAAWALNLVAENHPGLIEPQLETIIHKMTEAGAPVAVKRNVIRLLQFVPIPEELHGTVMNACFELLADPKETIAVRVFSMTVLANLAKIYPDIKQELKAIVNDVLEQGASAGFKSRVRRLGL
jgi:hypothetical protein